MPRTYISVPTRGLQPANTALELEVLDTFHRFQNETGDDVYCRFRPGQDEQIVVAAQSPALFLRWLAGTATSQTELLRWAKNAWQIEQGRKSVPAPATPVPADPPAGAIDMMETEAEEQPERSPARKRPRTDTHRNHTRDLMRKQQRQNAQQQVDLWHSRNEEREDIRWRHESDSWYTYIQKMKESRGIGVQAVHDIIKSCQSVGCTEAIQDFQFALSEWRRGLTLNKPTSSQRFIASEELEQSMSPSQQDDKGEIRMNYFKISYAERVGATLSIIRRFYAARLHAILVRRTSAHLGRKYGRVKAEQDAMFRAIYPNLEPQPTVREYNKFLRTLKFGRRWLRLEEEFGVGIFALLPQSTANSTYIERRVTDNVFTIWYTALKHCSPLAVAMARKISPYVTAIATNDQQLVEDTQLPLEIYQALDSIEDAVPTPRLAALVGVEQQLHRQPIVWSPGDFNERIQHRMQTLSPTPSISRPSSQGTLGGTTIAASITIDSESIVEGTEQESSSSK